MAGLSSLRFPVVIGLWRRSVGCASALPTPAWAQAAVIDGADTAWMLVATGLALGRVDGFHQNEAAGKGE